MAGRKSQKRSIVSKARQKKLAAQSQGSSLPKKKSKVKKKKGR